MRLISTEQEYRKFVRRCKRPSDVSMARLTFSNDLSTADSLRPHAKLLARGLERLDPLLHVVAPIVENRIGMLPGLRDSAITGERTVSLTRDIVGAAGQFKEVGTGYISVG